MSAYAKRKEGVFVFLLGMLDPNSPVSMLDSHVLRIIGAWRFQSVRVDKNDSVEWHDPDDQNAFHRGFPDIDMPAIIYADGLREWYKEGKRHRNKDMPAVIRADGSCEWYQEGRIHRGWKYVCGYTCKVVGK